jgi:hypothetical protein
MIMLSKYILQYNDWKWNENQGVQQISKLLPFTEGSYAWMNNETTLVRGRLEALRHSQLLILNENTTRFKWELDNQFSIYTRSWELKKPPLNTAHHSIPSRIAYHLHPIKITPSENEGDKAKNRGVKAQSLPHVLRWGLVQLLLFSSF